MLTGAIPEEYRRVTRSAQEGNWNVTGRLPEVTGVYGRVTGVYGRVTRVCTSVPK